MGRLLDRVALITGSDSGIGRGIALAFAEEGADVLVTYHTDKAGAEETASGVLSMGRRALLQRLGVTDPRSVAAGFDAAAAWAEVDILVNDAGLSGEHKPFVETSDVDFDRMMKTDLYGPFYCAREFVRRRGDRGGTIINISSVHEATPAPKYSSYNAAKGAFSPGPAAWRLSLRLKTIA